MMGLAQHTLKVPVIKSTNAVLAFSRDEEFFVKEPVCIRCGRCVRACPMNLMPIFIHQNAEKGDLEECQRYNVRDCIECGCCSYVCPARIPLVQSFRATKAKIVEASRK
jgi:electron transport complex protein RnfC